MPAVGSVYDSRYMNGVPPMALWPPSCWGAGALHQVPWHPTKCLMVALWSLKGRIALRRGLHSCHVSEGKVVAEAMTLLAGKAEGCGKCQEKYLPRWL